MSEKYAPASAASKKNSQYARAMNKVVRAGDALTDTFSEGQRAQFEEYMSAQREVTVLTDCETFCYAFKLGARIMMDVLTDGEMKEI